MVTTSKTNNFLKALLSMTKQKIIQLDFQGFFFSNIISKAYMLHALKILKRAIFVNVTALEDSFYKMNESNTKNHRKGQGAVVITIRHRFLIPLP